MEFLAMLVALSIGVEVPAHPPCPFAVVAAAPTEARVQGPEEILARFKLLDQTTSPVVVTDVDFSDAVLIAGPGTYHMEGRVRIEVMNISGAVVSQLQVGKSIRWPTGGGTSRISKLPHDLEPGQRGIVTMGGRAHGTRPKDTEVSVLVGFGAMLIDGCRFSPQPSIGFGPPTHQ
jgi:hypothetical protein